MSDWPHCAPPPSYPYPILKNSLCQTTQHCLGVYGYFTVYNKDGAPYPFGHSKAIHLFSNECNRPLLKDIWNLLRGNGLITGLDNRRVWI